MSSYIKLGTCQRAHGIKGQFSFSLLTGRQSILSGGEDLILSPKQGSSLKKETVWTLESIQHGNKSIATLKGVNSRTQSDLMVPFDILYPRDSFPETEGDEYYLNDLIGFGVIDFQTSLNRGRVEKFYENGAQDIIVIKTPQGLVEIPMVKTFLKEILFDEKKIIILFPSYL